MDEIGDVIPASGYALIHGSNMTHLGKVSLASARRSAMATGDSSIIAAAVGVADCDQLVWRKLEVVDRTQGGRFLRDDGELMLKLSPDAQIEEMTDAYADKLKDEYSYWAKGRLDEYFEGIDVDWYGVDDIGEVFSTAGSESILDSKQIGNLSSSWASASLLYMNRAAAQAREFSKKTFLPKIGSGITGADKQAMGFLSKQPGFFLRDQLGRVDAGLTKRGVGIVQAGMRDGLGYREIGAQLREQLPNLWGKYGANYANVVANNGVQRSRAFAEVSSYVEGGIEYAELVSVLDQRTTDICRYLDGQIISVGNIVEILNQTLEITNPEEIKQVAPWVSTRRDPTSGQSQLVTRNGVVLADIIRSGRGNLDDRGQYAARKMGDQLAVDASIGPPPYHGYCRTTMNPVVKSFTAPAGMWRQAISMVAQKPNPAAQVTTPSFLRGLTGATTVGSVGSGGRAMNTGRLPTQDRPVLIGSPLDPEAGVWGEDGWLEAQSDFVQVRRRISNAMTRLQDSLNEFSRAKGRRDLSYKQKGKFLNQIFAKRLKEIRSGSVALEKADYSFSAHERERGDMPRGKADAVRRYALSFLSDRMLRAVFRRKLPRIIQNNSPKGRPTGYWDTVENVMDLPEMRSAKSRAVILRVFAKYFDTFAHDGQAGVIARNQSLASNTIYNADGILYLDVATPSFFDGLIYGERGENKVNAATGSVTGSSETESDWTASAFECLADGMETSLGFMWDTAPRHIAYMMAYIEGQFV
jgi:hypothetical protein